MRLIAAIVDRRVVARILAHLGLPARAPPLCPARDDPSVNSHGEIDPALTRALAGFARAILGE
jgi:hypothetical protein